MFNDHNGSIQNKRRVVGRSGVFQIFKVFFFARVTLLWKIKREIYELLFFILAIIAISELG